MSILKRINARARTDENTGYGTNSTMYGGRLMNHNGRPNVKKRGLNYFERFSWYHTLIEMSRLKFLFIIFSYFLFINLLFACIYLLIGVEHLGGMVSNTPTEKFIEAYFFSAQTFTTVGYGRINPTGYLTSFVAALEAFTGLLFFALATGLFYARFSRPQAFLRFSDNIILAPYRSGVGLMFRMAPYKNNYLTDAEVKLTMGLLVDEGDRQINRFYQLDLELSKVNALSLSWTIVHPIDDNSPLKGLSKDDLINTRAEFLVFVKAFDETFSNTVVARTSYAGQDIVQGARFLPMYHRSRDAGTTVLELDKLNEMETVDISFALAAKSMTGS